MAETKREPRWHRIRFYKDMWSIFDEISPCAKPAWCIGCEFKHPICSEDGRVLSGLAKESERG